MKPEPTKEDFILASMAERKDMLILAQQKLDEIHRCNIGLSGGRPGSSSSRTRHRKSAMSNHLLSSLLYVALMLYKVEDMKALLKEEDSETFAEWDVLLNSLHSPEFHARERVIQNKRVKTAYERKRQYKDVSNGLQQELTDTSSKLTELQRISNETSQQMSRAINVLQDERAKLSSRGEEKQSEIDKLKDQLCELRAELDQTKADHKRKEASVEQLDTQLQARYARIKDLEDQTSRLLQDQAASNEKASFQDSALKDLASRLEQSESSLASYRTEKDALISDLRQELKESEARRAAAQAQLESSKVAWDSARNEFEESRKSVERKLEALDTDTKSSFSDVKAVLSNLDGTLSRTESLTKSANELQTQANNHTSLWMDKIQVLDTVLEGSDKLRDSVSKLSNQSEQIGNSFASVQSEVATTNEALSRLERLSDRIKESLTDVKISQSAASTNDVIIARLENRSVHIEEMLASVQHGLSVVMSKINDTSSLKDAPTEDEASSVRLEKQTREVLTKIDSLQQLVSTKLADISNNNEKITLNASDGFSKLESRTNDIIETLSQLQTPYSNEVFKEIDEKTSQIVHECVSKMLAGQSTQPLSNSNTLEQGAKSDDLIVESYSSTQEDTAMDEASRDVENNDSAVAANMLIESCVSEAVSAISPSTVPIEC